MSWEGVLVVRLGLLLCPENTCIQAVCCVSSAASSACTYKASGGESPSPGL